MRTNEEVRSPGRIGERGRGRCRGRAARAGAGDWHHGCAPRASCPRPPPPPPAQDAGHDPWGVCDFLRDWLEWPKDSIFIDSEVFGTYDHWDTVYCWAQRKAPLGVLFLSNDMLKKHDDGHGRSSWDCFCLKTEIPAWVRGLKGVARGLLTSKHRLLIVALDLECVAMGENLQTQIKEELMAQNCSKAEVEHAVGGQIFDISSYTAWKNGAEGKSVLQRVSDTLIELAEHVKDYLDQLGLDACYTSRGATLQMDERARERSTPFIQTWPKARIEKEPDQWERGLLRNRYHPHFDSRRININGAKNWQELADKLPQCGEIRAKKVMAMRKKPFECFDDFKDRMKGIGDRVMETWAPFVTFGPTPAQLAEFEAPDARVYGPRWRQSNG